MRTSCATTLMQAADYRIGRARVRPASRELIIDAEPAKLGARAFDLA
jgi:hypothetical protein